MQPTFKTNAKPQNFIMKKLFLYIICFIPLVQSFAGSKDKLSNNKPNLVVFINIDHLSNDYLNRYLNKFGDNGFKRLMNKGVYIPNTKHPYLTNQDAPGYTSLVTGAIPANHGIIADTWYKRLQEEVQNCTANNNYKSIGGSFQSGNFGPDKILAETLGDKLKVASQFNSKVFSISMDNRCAVLMGGHTCDAAYWLDNRTGNWVSSSYYMDSLNKNVKEFNAKNWQDVYMQKEWYTHYAIEEYNAGWRDNNEYESGFGKQKTFPYNLQKLKKDYGYGLLRGVPYGNKLTKDFAISTIYKEDLGKSSATDMICIGFSATQLIEDIFGPYSVEMQDTWIRLDNDIAHLLDYIDDEIGLNKSLIILTSGHGRSQETDYMTDNGIPGGYYNSKASLALLRSYLNILYGKEDWVTFYHQQQFYLNRKLIEDKELDMSKFQEKAANFLVEFTGINDVITSQTLRTNSFFGSPLQKFQNSFNPKRSGDLIVIMEPGYEEKVWTEKIKNYSDKVPTFFYGFGIDKNMIIREEKQSIDITPTICDIINIPEPNACTGKNIILNANE